MKMMMGVPKVVADAVLNGSITELSARSTEAGEQGRVVISNGWSMVTLKWHDGDMAFRVIGVNEAGNVTLRYNCEFSYESELGAELSDAISTAAMRLPIEVL